MNKNISYLKLLQGCVLIIGLLYFGQALFIPLSYALFISFIIYPWCKWLERIGCSKGVSIAISLFAIFMVVASIVSLLVVQFVSFTKQWPAIQTKLAAVAIQFESFVNTAFKTEHTGEFNWIDKILQTSSEQIFPIIKTTLYVSSVSTILILLIPVYVALILYYRRNLLYFLQHLFSENLKEEITTTLNEAILTYSSLIKGLIMVYIIVGSLNSLGLYLLGIPNPIFFGFVASILTIIPYVGITIGAILPMSIGWITYNSVFYPIGVIVIFTTVQVLEANLIFPMAVSRGLKINTLVTLIAMIGGGLIWGVSGMILFLPMVAILKLVADKIPELEPLSILLGSEGVRKTSSKKSKLSHSIDVMKDKPFFVPKKN